jgi:hypothetical protein
MRLFSAALLVGVTLACSAAVPPAPSPTTTQSLSGPIGSATATLTPAASASVPGGTDIGTPPVVSTLNEVFKPLTRGWSPAGTTLLFTTAVNFKLRLLAQPVGASGGAPATEVIEVTGGIGVRPDGARLAASVVTIDGNRLATYDLLSGDAAWLGPALPNTAISRPFWSKDGNSIYYVTGPTADFKGVVHRIAADGSGDAIVATLDRFGDILNITPDGGRLIWSRSQAGGSVEVLDTATGTNRHLEDNAGVTSMRGQQPRLLTRVGGCCAGPGGGALVLWNDDAMTSRALAPAGPRYLYGAASWDPTGRRVAAVRMDATTDYSTELVTIDPESGAQRAVPDTKDALAVLWLDEGLVVAFGGRRSPVMGVKLLPASGGPAVALDSRTDLWGAVIIRR